jgi:ElaB/YqjD/DUF883 family membrane-anchored ribosome-binding protein
MGGSKADQLSTEEAKARLRDAAGQLGVKAWVKRSPYEALTVSFAVGLVLASSRPLRDGLVRMFIRSL